jgi:hypothetical protein
MPSPLDYLANVPLRIIVFFLIAGTLVCPRDAWSVDSQTQAALNMIADTADRICQSAPLEHTEEGIKLNGDARAKVNGLLGKLADLGVQGSGQFNSEQSKGVLEAHIVDAMQASNNCKLTVFQTLEKDLIRSQTSIPNSSGTPLTTSTPVTPYDPSHVFWLDQKPIPTWAVIYDDLVEAQHFYLSREWPHNVPSPIGGLSDPSIQQYVRRFGCATPTLYGYLEYPADAENDKQNYSREQNQREYLEAVKHEGFQKMFLLDIFRMDILHGFDSPAPECLHTLHYYLVAYGYTTESEARLDIPRFEALADKLEQTSLLGKMSVVDLTDLCPTRHLDCGNTKEPGFCTCRAGNTVNDMSGH